MERERERGGERETLGRGEPWQRRNIAPEIAGDGEAVPTSGGHPHQQRARAQKCHGGEECRAAGEGVERENYGGGGDLPGVASDTCHKGFRVSGFGFRI